MHLGRCPICHAHLSLEALAQDAAARELLGLLASLDADLGRALIGYLTLFRPPKRDLSHDRALRLAREVLSIESDAARLAAALAETTEAIRSKGEQRPMRNHNYLARVLESTAADATASLPVARDDRAPRSRTAQAMRRLIEGA